jgi:hypothetical protein
MLPEPMTDEQRALFEVWFHFVAERHPKRTLTGAEAKAMLLDTFVAGWQAAEALNPAPPAPRPLRRPGPARRRMMYGR